jgi:hypothetical protein
VGVSHINQENQDSDTRRKKCHHQYESRQIEFATKNKTFAEQISCLASGRGAVCFRTSHLANSEPKVFSNNFEKQLQIIIPSQVGFGEE